MRDGRKEYDMSPIEASVARRNSGDSTVTHRGHRREHRAGVGGIHSKRRRRGRAAEEGKERKEGGREGRDGREPRMLRRRGPGRKQGMKPKKTGGRNGGSGMLRGFVSCQPGGDGAKPKEQAGTE